MQEQVKGAGCCYPNRELSALNELNLSYAKAAPSSRTRRDVKKADVTQASCLNE